ncbi:MAG: hypothetical protein ACR2JE_04050 [Acidobacteriaceae bacterium]
MKTLDLILGWLLVLVSLLHAVGSFAHYRGIPETLLWALSATLAGLLLAALNLLRVRRPDDRPLAWVSLGGCVGWLVIVFAFVRLIGNLLDVRVVIQGVVVLGLLAMCVRTLQCGSGLKTVRPL